MDRREFMTMAAGVGLAGAASLAGDAPRKVTAGVRELESLLGDSAMKGTERMPALFIGHGSPMNAIETNEYSESWRKLGTELPRPRAILSVSAHWLTHGDIRVTAMEHPKTIHDFGGFPQELFDVQYSAPGSPELASETQKIAHPKHILFDDEWGFDHGTWSVLNQMYPKADIPVVQLSLDYQMPPALHLEFAKSLAGLREKGVMIIGSGNVVHNLRAIKWDGGPNYAWADEFDAWVEKGLVNHDDNGLAGFQKLGDIAKLAHPTYDHYLPLLYSIAVRNQKDTMRFFNEGVSMGSLSMRSVIYQ
jgi:4,5-DOPA dioxygenase extradiol